MSDDSDFSETALISEMPTETTNPSRASHATVTQESSAEATTGTTATSVCTAGTPLNGGIETLGSERIPWTGGSRTKTRSGPASIKAYRPADYKSKRKCKEDCTEGIGEQFRLKTPNEIIKDTDATLLIDWVDQLRLFMEDTGQNGVFHLQHNGKEINLLEDFGALDPKEVADTVAIIKSENCPFDINNLKTSGVAIRASLSTSMLHRIKAMVAINGSGPEVLAAVIAAHQVLDSSGCRVLVNELTKLRLCEYPAENMDEFRLKIIEKGRRIDGCLDKPQDLPALVAECFRNTQSLEFNTEVASLYTQASARRIRDWQSIVTKLTALFKTLLNRGEWPAAKNRKEDVPKTIQAMFSNLEAKIDSKLKQTNVGGDKQQRGGSQNTGSQNETRTCHQCGQVGHIRLKNGGGSNKSNANNASNSTGNGKHKNPNPVPSSLPGKMRYEAPGANEMHTKTIGSDTWKWCNKCKRWNKGNAAHLTDEHKSKNQERSSASPKTTVGRLASSGREGILKQSTMGFMAKAGRSVNKDEISWCASCHRWVHSLEDHRHSIEHNQILGLQCMDCLPSSLHLKAKAGQK
jgi:hypothetical protein